jgi:glycosyltransferase involved in cell wall biosynthesis
MINTRAVTVLIPLGDAASTLGACLDSVQAQDLSDFELLVVDDGSADGSADIVAERSVEDPRIRSLRRPGSGLVASLNTGLLEARAPLVARMDADDLMHPMRLALQSGFLDRHPRVDVVASRVQGFPGNSMGTGMREYLRWQNSCVTPRALVDEIYVECPFTHPSVMYRRSAVLGAGGYREGAFPEDYDLWLRLVQAGSGLAKLDRCLLAWRQSPESHSRRDPRYARAAFDRLRAIYLARDQRLRCGRPLAYWGAGRRTRQRASHLIEHGLAPCAWIDIDPRKIGNRIDGVPVQPPQWLARVRVRPFVLVYVANHGARQEIGPELEAMGYERGRDYLMVG